MISIQKIPVGFPAKQAELISIRLLPFQTTDLSCSIYYQLFSKTTTTVEDAEDTISTEQLAEGNLHLSEDEFAAWDNTMTYVEDLIINKLGLTRNL